MSDLRASLDHLRPGIDASTRLALDRTLDALPLSDATAPLVEAAVGAISSGKRFRALCACIGASLTSGHPLEEIRLDELTAALELYQASALVHDDVIDHADTRRGRPTPHRTFATLHRNAGWLGSATDFGVGAAILLGDLLFSAAQTSAQAHAHGLAAPLRARFLARWNHMHTEVALGQYLDLGAEQRPLDPTDDDAVSLPAAMTVALHKSARYSVVHPTVLGAISAGAPDAVVSALEAVLTPWGLAFQLRDDVLGVLGDPSVTGKPAGDDLREGKRTALLACTWTASTSTERRLLTATLGQGADSDEAALATAIDLVRERGAQPHEALIAQLVDEGAQALEAAPIDEDGRRRLRELGAVLTDRVL